MENDLLIVSSEEIKNLIYTIRGKQVMLDSDVANLYRYKTKVLNLTVKRNIERFPEEFCFQLTEEELENLRFQIETSKKEKMHGGRRYLPYVFTEQGIAMLSGILKSEIAVKVSINIINAFVQMRKFISSNAQIFDAYSLIIDFIKKAKNKIVIIDNYIDDSILKMLSKKKEKVEVILLTSNKSTISNLDIQKFNKEYPILKM